VLFRHPIFLSATLNISYQFRVDRTPHNSFADTGHKGLGRISAEFRFKLARINRIALVVAIKEQIREGHGVKMAGVRGIFKI
jgi:hypothetical protein